MRKFLYFLTIMAGLTLESCSSDDDGIDEHAVTPTCTDGLQNGQETGIDCGGSCTPCETGTENPEEIENPDTYVFEREGESTVDFNGQTTRLKMGSEFISALGDNTNTVGAVAGDVRP